MSSTKVSEQTRSAVGGQSVTITTTFANLTRAVYVGTAGNLSVVFSDGSTVTINDAANGYHPLQLSGINGTGTTAGNVVALF